jgi:hypothetical protein
VTNAALVPVTPEVLDDWFCLPDGNRVVGVQWDSIRRLVVFRVEGPDMPACEPGAVPLTITPSYRRKDHELVKLGTP